MLKQRYCDTVSASPVDFDLALKELEDSDLVNTGPMFASSSPGILAVFSTREYVYLTEKGYKAAQKTRSKKASSATPTVHISGGHFHQSPIGIGEHVTQSLTVTLRESPVFIGLRKAIGDVSNENDRTRLLAGIEAMQTAHTQQDYAARFSAFVQLAANYTGLPSTSSAAYP
jgi:hypothetical protein